MRSPQIGVTIALSAWSLSRGTAAQECETSSTIDPETGAHVLRVTSPDQLSVFEDCTTLTGDISIEPEYSGDFILNDVTELKGALSIPSSVPGLGRIELRDLVESGNISFPGLFGDVSLPSLERAVYIDLFQEGESGEVDLGSLVEAGDVTVRGGWTSINLESLKTVGNDISFCGGPGCGGGPADYEREYRWLEIDLPSLEKADYLDLQGVIKSISVPNLEVLGYVPPTEIYYGQGLRMSISEGGHLLDFDAPKLHTLNRSLEVYGAVNSLSLGALGETNIGATINARGPLKIYSTIRTASHFYLWQDLESIWLPDMVDLGTVDVSLNERLTCNDTLYQLWETQSSHSSQWEDYNTCLDYDYPQEVDEDEEDTDTEEGADDTANTDDTSDSSDSSDSSDTNDTSDTNEVEDSDSDSASDPPASDTSTEAGDSSEDEEHVPGNAAAGISLPTAGSLGLMVIALISVALY
ncbi:hypothetical protein BJY00DRAFT_312738 [Aspergillus carlsbadensis]|nr:hypothetical protein BJY00DRAFT_312738 [Aspergillus carlsbadensis]